MCGIFGFTGPPDPGRLAALGVALRHRGPDGRGEWAGPRASLGCDRLSIVCPADGAQPLTSEDGRLHLVCNGEIYNHRALRRDLEARGHRFATGSDVEVALHAYEDDGEAAFARLHGMFALAIWDAARRRLILARDRAGMKPLCYARHAGRWWFASEAKALLLAAEMPRRLDLGALDGLLRLGFVPGPATLFAAIRRLPAGHLMTLDASDESPAAGAGEATAATPRIVPFPAPPPSRLPMGAPPSFDGADLAGELRRRLGAAVDSHLAADVPVGISLSGGLDSSFLAALAAERVGPGLRTFSIGAAGDQDERPFARRMADHLRSDHCEIATDADALWARLPRVVWNAEEPRSGPLVPNDLLFARAARDVRVLLLGEGADELFGGYLRFKTALPPLDHLPARAAAALYGSRKAGADGSLYAGDLAAAAGDSDPLRTHLGPALAATGRARLAALLAHEQDAQLPNAHLPRVDLLTMAHSLEGRLPFLDHGVVELARQVPLAMKVGWRQEKQVVRDAARGLLPAGILERRKQGQANPFRLWQASGMLDHAADLLAAPALRARGLFRPAAVHRILARLQRGRGLPFDRNRLHLLVLVEIWHRLFLDPERLAAPPPEPALFSLPPGPAAA